MHEHSHHTITISRLKWALILTIIVFIVEFLGALSSRSLSVLSNAVHLLSDVGAMGLAYYAARIENNPPTKQLSYGYARSGILASLINSLILVILAIGLIIAGIYRFIRPEPVMAGAIIWLGLVAFLFNILVTGLLMPRDKHDLNLRAMFWHAASDAAGSLSVIVSGLLIWWTHFNGFDPLAGMLIGVILLKAALGISAQSVNILMEGTPPGVKPQDIEHALLTIPRVHEVHHLHIWALRSDYNLLSAHILIDNVSVKEGQEILAAIARYLQDHFPIHHVTIQLETQQHDHVDDDCHPHLPSHPEKD
ncbi:cation diffusion facilitator family transporter [Sulfobacillus thermosulfidooxidans]|uniref:cation diffusion facilitator family transporter n=1 Tax=Sulfobacillus thermosulfidooxidans TaxID=28034 RepID=UPI00048E8EE8|nr:cation diffusion facilitator family transporter [Sulfobacillus thermosulfidooxidans]